MLRTTRAKISLNGKDLVLHGEEFLTDERESLASVSSNKRNRTLYGTDLEMLATGSLAIDVNNPRDLSRVSGIVNYAQAITHRLMTDRGTHPEDRFFGVPWSKYLGSTYMSKSLVISELVADVTEELYKDHRTQEVISVSAEFESNNTIAVTCSIAPIGFERNVIDVSFAVEDRLS